MIQEQITLHRIWFTYDQEAEQAASRFRQCEGCIDILVGMDGVAVYTQRTVTRAVRDVGSCRIVALGSHRNTYDPA